MLVNREICNEILIKTSSKEQKKKELRRSRRVNLGIAERREESLVGKLV